MRWWGWGEDGHPVSLPEPAQALLREELGADLATRHSPVALEEVRLPEPRLPAGARSRLEAAVGAEQIFDDRPARVAHAAGRSYADLLRLRSGDASHAPDAVVEPGSADQVQAVLAACEEARVAVVPFGGGTSVVGGVEPLSDGFDGAVALDLRRLDRVVEVDGASLTATLEAGLLGPEAERRLGEHGVTLGHFPQSFEYSTVGGWVATRSAGQASSGYGRIDELVEGLRLVAPAGEVRRRAVPASAAGPDLGELVVGSEGVLGVICEATLRVRPVPRARRYEGWSFRSFAEGREAFRVMEQADAAPDVARLSDEEETRLTLSLASSGGAAQRARYAGPYLRDELLDRGLLVETLETAPGWSGLEALYEAVREALDRSLAEAGTPALVMCHMSHLYRSGASLYFTFIARQADDPLAQWRAAKSAASEAIVASGGTITHHHAVGRDHAPWMRAEVGELGLELIRAAKQRLDPAGIMNPGKLLPD